MTEDRFHDAALAILQADALLVCTGAGMGVDSGLGTWRGISDQFASDSMQVNLYSKALP